MQNSAWVNFLEIILPLAFEKGDSQNHSSVRIEAGFS